MKNLFRGTLILAILVGGFKFCAAGPVLGKDKGTIATAINSDPQKLPTISAWLHSRDIAFIAATFPDVPGFRVDACAYEPSDGFLFLNLAGAEVPEDNKLVLRHRLRDYAEFIHVTTFTAEPGAIDVVAHLERDSQSKDADTKLPEKMMAPNMCWGFEGGANFAAGGETPELYPKWISRCFIITDQGRVFMDKTDRPKTNEVPEDDPRNNAPGAWSMHYIGLWQPAKPLMFMNQSADRYTIPLVGAVSNDGKYLTALVNETSRYAAQAWHTCLHHEPQWEPADAPPLQRTWRMKLYAMKNDPDELLARVNKDFPGIGELKNKRME